MNKDLIIALLALAFAGSAAALLIVIAKLYQARQAIWDERSVHLSEYKAVVHDNEILLEGGRKDAETIRNLEQSLRTTASVAANATAGNAALQDKLSAILCPRNDHVWKDGRCVKCGRMKDD